MVTPISENLISKTIFRFGTTNSKLVSTMISETLIQKLDLGLIHKLPEVNGINSNNNYVMTTTIDKRL